MGCPDWRLKVRVRQAISPNPSAVLDTEHGEGLGLGTGSLEPLFITQGWPDPPWEAREVILFSHTLGVSLLPTSHLDDSVLQALGAGLSAEGWDRGHMGGNVHFPGQVRAPHFHCVIGSTGYVSGFALNSLSSFIMN